MNDYGDFKGLKLAWAEGKLLEYMPTGQRNWVLWGDPTCIDFSLGDRWRAVDDQSAYRPDQSWVEVRKAWARGEEVEYYHGGSLAWMTWQSKERLRYGGEMWRVRPKVRQLRVRLYWVPESMVCGIAYSDRPNLPHGCEWLGDWVDVPGQTS